MFFSKFTVGMADNRVVGTMKRMIENIRSFRGIDNKHLLFSTTITYSFILNPSIS